MFGCTNEAVRNKPRRGLYLYLNVAVLALIAIAMTLSHAPAVSAAPQTPNPDYGDYIPRGQYLSPVAMAISRDGRWLYVVCEDSNALLAVDTRTRQVVHRVRAQIHQKLVEAATTNPRAAISCSWVS